jgi:hypothetical protein
VASEAAKEGKIDTSSWATRSQGQQQRRLAKNCALNAANFGIGGDMTQNVLWRIRAARSARKWCAR